MSRAWGRRAAAGLVIAWLSAGAGLPAVAQSVPAAGDFIYHTRPHDTLIGLCRVMLIDPSRWRAVQTRNAIADPRRIPVGSTLRIPYAWLRLTPENATVARVAGAVQSAGAALLPGQLLPQGSAIQTGPDGSVTLDLADGSVITLQKSSVLSLDEMQRIPGPDAAHDLHLQLKSGRTQSVVKPHRDVGRFEIDTPVAISAVRGTVFRSGFNADGDDATTETLDGTVAVGDQSAAVAVSEGFGTRVNRNQPPTAPVPLLPPPGLAAIPARSTEATLRVELAAVAGAAAYRVQLSTDANFYALAADEVSSSPVLSFAGLADGNYWLRARGIDPNDIEGADAVMTLVRHLLPAAPAPVGPLKTASVAGGQVTFEWGAVAGAASYRLQVARDAGFGDLALEQPALAATRTLQALPAGHYFWRVAGADTGGENGAWTDTQDFTVLPDAPLPEPPLLDHHQLMLHWQEHPGERYRVQIARDPEFKRILTDRSVDQAQLASKRPYPGIYYARVQIVTADGTVGPFGPTRRFEVPVPIWVEILLPILMVAPLLW